jgi:uncharacterized Fe-S cluster-containing radical SAM superfamily protein/tRNA A-37 threonylcarbamoyl transferase component Bud32
MFLFPCPGCRSALHIEMSGLEHTAPATVSCRLCRIPVSVPRFGNRVLISAGDLFQVFRAVDRPSGQVIALKSISRSRLRDWVIQKREDRASSRPRPPDGALDATVEEEIRSVETRIRDMASALHSLPATPYLIRLVDFCEDGREFNFVMELLKGETLAAHIRNSGPLDRRRAAEIARCLLAALDAIHAAGVGHGDIRAEHIICRSTDSQDFSTPVLCGFGLGTVDSTVRASMETLSPSWVRAPNGALFSPRADLQAVGGIFHSLVAGIHTDAQSRGIAALGTGWTAGCIKRLLQAAGRDSFSTAAETLADLDARRRRCAAATVRFSFPGNVDIPNLSECLYIMPATACNLRCRFCGCGKMSLAKQIMADNLFARVVTEACRFGFSRFGLTPMVGEALLDPHLLEKLEFLERCPDVAGYSFCTNFVAADAAFIKSLLRLRKLQWLSISICGHDPESFTALTETGPEVFERQLDNLEHLAGVPSLPFSLELRVRTVRSFDPGAQTSRLGSLLRHFAERKAQLRIPHDLYSNRGGLISIQDLAGVDIALKEEVPKSNSPCVFLFYKHTVLPDGRLNACYTGDVNATMVIGDLSRQSLEEIYSLDNETWLRLIEGQLRGCFTGFCRSCTDYRSVTESHYSFRYHEKLNLRLSDFLDQLR